MLRRSLIWTGLAMAGGSALPRGAAQAHGAAPALSMEALAARAARRYPQPVRVGDLIGRKVLQPLESQPVLGRVAAVVRRGDGGLDMIVLYGGLFGFGARPIAVPVDAMALMGEYTAILDYTPEQLAAFPTAAADLPALQPAEVIRVPLTKPFH